MSYNGIGLSSVRGTATSGHVQANQGHVRASRLRRQRENNRQTSERKQFHPVSASAREKGNQELQQHDQRRKLENHLLVLRDDMEVAGTLSEAEIDVRVNKERERLLLQQKEMEDADAARKAQREADAAKRLEDSNAPKEAASLQGHGRGPEHWHQQCQPHNSWDRRQGGRNKNNHVNAARKEHENERLRDAFGIRKDRHIEGQAFDQDLQKDKKRERQAKLEEEQKVAEMAERKRLKAMAKVEKKVAREQKKLDAAGERKEKRRRHRSPSSSSSDSSGTYSSRSHSSSSSDSSLSSAKGHRQRRQRRARSDSTSSLSSGDRRLLSKEQKRKNGEKGVNVDKHGRDSKSSSPSSKRRRGGDDHDTVPMKHTRVEKDKDKSRPHAKERGHSRSSSYTSNSSRSSRSNSRSRSHSPGHARKPKAGGGKEKLASNNRLGMSQKSRPTDADRNRSNDRPPGLSSYTSNSTRSSQSGSRSRSHSPGHARKAKEKLASNNRLGTPKKPLPSADHSCGNACLSSYASNSSRSSQSDSRSRSRSPGHARKAKAGGSKEKLASNDCLGTSDKSHPSVADRNGGDGKLPSKEQQGKKETIKRKPEKGGKRRRSQSLSSGSQSSRSSRSRSRSVSKATNRKTKPERKPKPRRERSTSVDSFGRVRPVQQKRGRSASPRSSRSSSSGSGRSRSCSYSR